MAKRETGARRGSWAAERVMGGKERYGWLRERRVAKREMGGKERWMDSKEMGGWQ
jgi:hypothetical protein